MTDANLPRECEDIYKIPVGELLALSGEKLDALIARAEENYQIAAYAIQTAAGIAHCLQRFLSLSSDWRALAQLTIPDYSNLRWDSLTAGAARELWGF